MRTAVSAALVGRDAELTQVEDALDAAIAGGGSVLFLVGEAGIGKSRLAQALATRARRNGPRCCRAAPCRAPHRRRTVRWPKRCPQPREPAPDRTPPESAHGLTVWRARALQELGAIDMLLGRPLDRLESARELALAHGAMATAAVVDVQLAAGLVLSDDPDAGLVAARRSAELSRRYHLDQTLAASPGPRGVCPRSRPAARGDAALH